MNRKEYLILILIFLFMINIEVYSRGFKKENRSRLPYHSRVISYILVGRYHFKFDR